MGIKALRKILLGAETTAGTAVAADTIWRGIGGLKDNREVITPDEDIGYLSGKARNYCPKYEAAILEACAAAEAKIAEIITDYHEAVKARGLHPTERRIEQEMFA